VSGKVTDSGSNEAAAREATETVGRTAGSVVDEAQPQREPIFDVRDVNVYYGEKRAVRNVYAALHRNEITALIGPSGCGKSTLIRCLNRMNDLIPSARVEGEVVYHGVPPRPAHPPGRPRHHG